MILLGVRIFRIWSGVRLLFCKVLGKVQFGVLGSVRFSVRFGVGSGFCSVVWHSALVSIWGWFLDPFLSTFDYIWYEAQFGSWFEVMLAVKGLFRLESFWGSVSVSWSEIWFGVGFGSSNRGQFGSTFYLVRLRVGIRFHVRGLARSGFGFMSGLVGSTKFGSRRGSVRYGFGYGVRLGFPFR